jgi:hypothetical protein
MLRDALREMERAVRVDAAVRRRRAEARAELCRAEAFAAQVEELLELEQRSAPETLVLEIRRFVRRHSRRLARGLSGRPGPARLLDVLFDVQERIQQGMEQARMPSAA